jgi:hypothetical protein
VCLVGSDDGVMVMDGNDYDEHERCIVISLQRPLANGLYACFYEDHVFFLPFTSTSRWIWLWLWFYVFFSSCVSAAGGVFFFLV